MRRDPSLPFHPPPPYAPRDMVDDSPDSMSAQLVAPPAEDGNVLNTPTMETWIKEKSREELSDLLVAAEDIIKTRESGASILPLFVAILLRRQNRAIII